MQGPGDPVCVFGGGESGLEKGAEEYGLRGSESEEAKGENKREA